MKQSKRWNSILCICCFLLFVALIFLLYRDGYFTSLYQTFNAADYHYEDNAQYIQRSSMFLLSPVEKSDIVFVGDSITARSEWQEFFPDKIILNRGIDSDVTEGVLNRLDTVTASKPDKIFIMIGINDIRQGIDSKNTLSNYEQIVSRLSGTLPDSDIYIQSILPVNSKTGIDNRNVISLNSSIKELADSYGLTYIDIYSDMADENNDLPAAYSIDGVHMTGDGYQIWLDHLKQYIN